jgi:hypothetical protein
MKEGQLPETVFLHINMAHKRKIFLSDCGNQQLGWQNGTFGVNATYGTQVMYNGTCVWTITGPTGSLIQLAVDNYYVSGTHFLSLLL